MKTGPLLELFNNYTERWNFPELLKSLHGITTSNQKESHTPLWRIALVGVDYDKKKDTILGSDARQLLLLLGQLEKWNIPVNMESLELELFNFTFKRDYFDNQEETDIILLLDVPFRARVLDFENPESCLGDTFFTSSKHAQDWDAWKKKALSTKAKIVAMTRGIDCVNPHFFTGDIFEGDVLKDDNFQKVSTEADIVDVVGQRGFLLGLQEICAPDLKERILSPV